jgi:hypothetical protein
MLPMGYMPSQLSAADFFCSQTVNFWFGDTKSPHPLHLPIRLLAA